MEGILGLTFPIFQVKKSRMLERIMFGRIIGLETKF